MWSIFIPAAEHNIEALSAQLWELGTAGLLEECGGLRAFFDDSIDRAAPCEIFSLRSNDIREEHAFDPSNAPSLETDPILIGEKFFIAPSSSRVPAPPGRIPLIVDSTNAFGTGRHETTQLCLEALEKHLKPHHYVVDIGCGSGILSLAATSLGAGTVVSCDIHEGSATAARDLLTSPLFVGSADGLRSQIADLVLANLTGGILDLVAFDLQRIVKPSGLLIVSGFITENLPARFKPTACETRNDWCCWICRPSDICAPAPTEESPAHDQRWWL